MFHFKCTVSAQLGYIYSTYSSKTAQTMLNICQVSAGSMLTWILSKLQRVANERGVGVLLPIKTL